MEKERFKSYMMGPTIHKVEMRAFDDLHTFLYISCKICKHQEQCENIKHKSDICVVARKLEKIVGPISYCRVASFMTDEFYIKRDHMKIIKDTVKFFRMKYIIDDENVR